MTNDSSAADFPGEPEKVVSMLRDEMCLETPMEKLGFVSGAGGTWRPA